MVHLRVFLLAERIQLSAAQDITIAKLKTTVAHENHDSLVAIIQAAYEHGFPPNWAGTRLKNTLVCEAVGRASELTSNDAFKEYLGQENAFASDLFEAMVKARGPPQ